MNLFTLVGICLNARQTTIKKYSPGVILQIHTAFLRGVGVLVSAALLAGCAAHQARQISGFDEHFEASNYVAASEYAMDKAGPGDKAPENLLWTLQAASALRGAADYRTSNAYFDFAEALMTREDGESLIRDGGENALAVLVNDSVMGYEPAIYDGVMVNTFKALNMLAEGDLGNARVELNRADDRQRRAVEAFAKEIAKRQEELEERQAAETAKHRGGANRVDTKRSLAVVERKVLSHIELDRWAAYPDFVNPFATYVNGLFFLLAATDTGDAGDLRKSHDALKRVASMVPDNDYVQQDLALVEGLSSGGLEQPLEPVVWVLFENGLGPVKRERRFDIPLFLVSDDVLYTSIALPKLEPRPAATKSLRIADGNELQLKTATVADMDRVIGTEFKKDYSYVLTRAVLGAILKTYVQSEITRTSGAAAGIVAALIQRATTEADQRMWTALPKEFQVARFARPATGTVTIGSPDLAPVEVSLPDAPFSIVYVKAARAGTTPSHVVMSFPPERLVSQN
ncbi:COG3014 family protein [Alkalilimnicola sp. S0819]|uniref:COG3014 family protein n=1 Tax=Alkalilimnicola sp. S0819 TaxID=2613922 RepID=UPI001262A64C|nr:hypothetical protein [Alkalilimnicola sp. S0819]KAB7624117.1 hypothetical protein F3N43_06935 [Alkalilimnicola sp. S0819]MPQ16369.1 hypothetical protein [Alkalilimnicola sp. S0819]